MANAWHSYSIVHASMNICPPLEHDCFALFVMVRAPWFEVPETPWLAGKSSSWAELS